MRRPREPRVGLEPITRGLPQLLCILAPWSLLVAGRGVCLVAQRIPPLVWLVRLVLRRRNTWVSRRR